MNSLKFGVLKEVWSKKLFMLQEIRKGFMAFELDLES